MSGMIAQYLRSRISCHLSAVGVFHGVFLLHPVPIQQHRLLKAFSPLYSQRIPNSARLSSILRITRSLSCVALSPFTVFLSLPSPPLLSHTFQISGHLSLRNIRRLVSRCFSPRSILRLDSHRFSRRIIPHLDCRRFPRNILSLSRSLSYYLTSSI